MNIKQITDSIFYVGVNDRHSDLFEALWPLPNGITYNSYIVRGSYKTALIDCVDTPDAGRLINNILTATGGNAPDYLIINHMEPDHSGAISILRNRFPHMIIVGNAVTLEMLNGFYGISDNTFPISDGYSIDLGDKSLTFHLTPMVHWPETMMTYVAEEKALFTGDAFGCFGALSGAVIDRDMDISPFIPEMYRYYSNIVGKYGTAVQRAIKKLAPLAIDYLCPTHGPVWYSETPRIINIYDRLSRYEAETGVVIVYGSMYGNTTLMAEEIASRLASRGIKTIKIHDVSRSSLSDILRDIFRYQGLIVGAPTYSGALFPPIEAVMRAIKLRNVQNRIIALFGSYSWASRAVNELHSLIDETKLQLACVPIDAKQAPSVTDLAECAMLADNVADALLTKTVATI